MVLVMAFVVRVFRTEMAISGNVVIAFCSMLLVSEIIFIALVRQLEQAFCF